MVRHLYAMEANRSITIGVALLTLCGLFVLGGADIPFAPHDDVGPEEQSLAADSDQYVGEPIVTSGVVTDADMNQIQISPDETDLVVTLDIGPTHGTALEDGHKVSFSGTITQDRTVVVGPDDHISVRAPWERIYMYAISFLGAILTGLLILNYWRVDPHRLLVEPREEPIFTVLKEDDFDG